MTNLPTLSVANARLPQTYEAAKAALAECARVDECMDWADKAEALAAYARISNDDKLHRYADRIKGRAVRRAGELLKQFDGRGDNKRIESAPDDTFLPPTQRQVAESAGLSRKQQVTAVRIANIPEPEFEAAIESPEPPTITALAEAGTKKRPPIGFPGGPEAPPGFAEATQMLGQLGEFAVTCQKRDPIFVAGGVLPREVGRARQHVAAIDAWLDRFVTHLTKAA